MRTLLTAVLTIAFAAAFVAVCVVHSLVAVTADEDAFVALARDGRVRDSLIDALEVAAYRELAADPRLPEPSRPALRELIAGVVDQAWFERSLRRAHGDLRGALAGASDTAVIDLREVKRHVRGAFREVGERAVAECAAVFGPQACSSSAEARQLFAMYEGEVAAAIGDLPDEVDLVAAVGGRRGRGPVSEIAELRQVRERLADLRTYRWLGLGLVVIGFGLIALVNATSVARCLTACGLALALAAGAYLGTGELHGVVTERVTAYAARRRAELTGARETDAVGERAVERFSSALADRAFGGATGLVAALGVIGVGAFAAGTVLRR